MREKKVRPHQVAITCAKCEPICAGGAACIISHERSGCKVTEKERTFSERDALKEEIKRRIPCSRYLERARKGGYICYSCGSGSRSGTGAVSYNPARNTWICNSCGAGADVIELYKLRFSVCFNQALEDLAGELCAAASESRRSSSGGVAGAALEAPENREEPAPDFSEYLKECRRRLDDPEAVAYLQRRGISLKTARTCGLGYDPAADPAGRPGKSCGSWRQNAAKRIIIASCPAHYIGRRIDGIEKFEKLAAKGSRKDIFNRAALKNDALREIFVCEGPFDALAVMEAGPQAVALFGVDKNRFLQEVREIRPAAVLVLCLDNDAAGAGAAADLEKGLDAMGAAWIRADISGAHKDPSEALEADRAEFESRVLEAVEKARKKAQKQPAGRGSAADRAGNEQKERKNR